MIYGCKIMVLLTLCHFLDHPVKVKHTVVKYATKNVQYKAQRRWQVWPLTVSMLNSTAIAFLLQ